MKTLPLTAILLITALFFGAAIWSHGENIEASKRVNAICEKRCKRKNQEYTYENAIGAGNVVKYCSCK